MTGQGAASRRSLRLLLLAASLVAVGLTAIAVSARLLADQPPIWVIAAVAAGTLALGLLGWRSGRVRRSSSSILLTAAILCALGLAAASGELLFLLLLGHFPDRNEQRLVWPAVGGIVLAGGLARPLARRAVQIVQRVLHGRRRSPDELLAAFTERSAHGVALDELLRELAESLRRTWQLGSVEIWTGDGSRLDRTLVVPAPSAGQTLTEILGADLRALGRAGVAGRAWLGLWLPALLTGRDRREIRVAPAVHAESVLALLVAERGADADRFTEREERGLAEAARRLGTVLHNRALDSALRQTLDDLRLANAELQASRARLVAAADAERRRIERDLHDGVQQHLVALAVGLNLLRPATDAADADPATAELVDELDSGIRTTINDLRNLAHGIYPPLLRHSGLPEALRAAATRSPLSVTVQAQNAGRYPEAVEAAVYFCCLEALQNAAKHAPGSTVLVEVGEVDGELRFAVRDDGPGFDLNAAADGTGRQNMADRLGAIGGLVHWESAPGGGTTVLGQIPLPDASLAASATSDGPR